VIAKHLGGSRGTALAEAAIVALLVLLITTWFAAWPPGLSPTVPLLALLAALVFRVAAPGRLRDSFRWRPPAPETLVCLLLAVIYRLPALLHPWGLVNRDGAYGATIALHLLQGARPAPIFTEGANYQGSLKGHLSALFALASGSRDFSWLMMLSSLVLYLVFVGATMALARRIGGRTAAVVAGLYLALSPKFLTTFSLNCVGQYMDVLGLGGLAVALLARGLDEGTAGSSARARWFAVGLLLGAAFWQQPVALAYVGAALIALALRSATWRDPATMAMPLGLLVGSLPVLLWNLGNDWASGGILGREPSELALQAGALGVQIARTLSTSLPVLAGLSPGHPWGGVPAVRAAAVLVLPLAFVGYLAVTGRAMAGDGRGFGPRASLLPPLLACCCLGLFWATASGGIHHRPRYLLPVLAASAVHLGVVAAAVGRRWPVPAAIVVALLLAFNVSGSWPRLRESAAIEGWYRGLLRSLEEKAIRTGYSDFRIAAPVTMFTAERITVSPRLGPTPAYTSDRQEERVERDGPDAYLLTPADDPRKFARVLEGLRVEYRFDPGPIPTFYGFSRRVRLDEVLGFRGDSPPEPTTEE
jgi:hypothetical protein